MMVAQVQPGACDLDNRNCGWLQLIARLKPQLTRQQAQADVAAFIANGANTFTGKAGDRIADPARVLVIDGSRGYLDRVSDISLPLKLLMGVVGFVLFTACANVANLLLARASARRKEMAIRLAVGSGHWRIIRQLLTECMMLAALGGAFGLLLASWSTGVLLAFEQQTSYVPRNFDSGLDGRAIGFTAVLSFLSVLLFGLTPAFQGARANLAAVIKGDAPRFGGRRALSLRNTLVVIQVALSLIALVGAGLCVKSLRALQAIDPGFDPAKVVTASFDLSLNGYNETRGRQFILQLAERVASLPGVEAVSFARIPAFSDIPWICPAIPEGERPEPVICNAIGPRYFQTIGTRIVHGREFTEHDGATTSRVFIINDAMARRYWPSHDAVGQRLNGGHVVGVVRNTKEKGLTEDPRPTLYSDLLQNYAPDFTLHIRTSMRPQTLLSALRHKLHTLDPTLPMYNMRTLAEQRDGSLYAERLAARLLTLFGVLALLLTAIGLYGALWCAVTESTREMGIRIALGAKPRDLLQIVLGQGILLTLLGLGIGLAASCALTGLLQRLLFGLSPTDPGTFSAISLLLAVVALLACWMPARRAMRMNPIETLRYQ
jgi:predicted permease